MIPINHEEGIHSPRLRWYRTSEDEHICQYLHFAQTEYIWLISAYKGRRGVLLIPEMPYLI